MQDSSSQDILDELNHKRRRWSIWPFCAVLLVSFCLLAVYARPPVWAMTLGFILLTSLTVVMSIRDTVRKTAVLLYDLDDALFEQYRAFNSAFDDAATCQRIWHVQSRAAVLDGKYHSGAATLINTDPTFLVKAAPPGLKTNLQPPVIRLAETALYFFPDRVFVLDSNGFGAIAYLAFRCEAVRGTFVLGGESLPSDATVVEYTWHFVNKRGGPDRRFSNNPQIPKLATVDLIFQSSSGFTGVLKFSNVARGESFCKAVCNFMASTSSANSPSRFLPENGSVSSRLYCWLDEHVAGPFTAQDLSQLEHSGKVNGDTLVCREGEKSWHPLHVIRNAT